jgi:hypothetical protein
MTGENLEERGTPQPPVDRHTTADPSEGKFRHDELCRMAAFRIREAANRIATLANSVHDVSLRGELLAVCERLLAEERDLLVLGRR